MQWPAYDIRTTMSLWTGHRSGFQQREPAAARPPPNVGRRGFALSNVFLPRGEDGRPSRSVVDSYTNTGFVVNGTLLPGAVILLPEAALLWNVESMEDITWDSLIALRVLSPKPGRLPSSRARLQALSVPAMQSAWPGVAGQERTTAHWLAKAQPCDNRQRSVADADNARCCCRRRRARAEMCIVGTGRRIQRLPPAVMDQARHRPARSARLRPRATVRTGTR